MVAGNHTFLGINEIEAQDRVNEERTGVPALGSGLLLLLHATIKGTSGVRAVNIGEHAAHIRLRHQGQTKSVTGEFMVAHATGTNQFVGRLAQRDITPGTVVITNAGAPATVVDNGSGVLVDTGTTTVRGSIDYATGLIDINTASIALTAVAFTVAFTFNPFGARIVPGAAAKMFDTYDNSIPEFTSQPWAAGLKGEARVGLVGEADEAGANGSALVTQWSHYGEEPYRVEAAFSGFPPGGAFAVAGNSNA